MPTSRDLLDEFQATWHDMKQALDENRSATDTKIRSLTARLDQLETAQRRPLLSATPGYDVTTPPSPDVKLFFRMVTANGPQGLRNPEERHAAEQLLARIETKVLGGPREAKALVLGDDTLGGFLAPPDFVQEIIKGIQLVSPIRQIARVRPTAARSVQVPTRSGVFAASWVGETATRTEATGLTYSLEELPTYELSALVLISLQDLEDSAFDFAREISDTAAEQFAKTEGAAFVNGDSVKKPEGFMTNAAIANTVSGDANLLTGDGLINLVYALKSGYAARARIVANRATIGKIRLLKDSYNRYLWEPNYQVGSPPTILGIPYVECPDMPDVGPNAYPVAVGDFSRGYLIVDRVDMQAIRMNEKYAEQGQVGFLLRKRVGGQVVLPEAIRKQKIST